MKFRIGHGGSETLVLAAGALVFAGLALWFLILDAVWPFGMRGAEWIRRGDSPVFFWSTIAFYLLVALAAAWACLFMSGLTSLADPDRRVRNSALAGTAYVGIACGLAGFALWGLLTGAAWAPAFGRATWMERPGTVLAISAMWLVIAALLAWAARDRFGAVAEFRRQSRESSPVGRKHRV